MNAGLGIQIPESCLDNASKVNYVWYFQNWFCCPVCNRAEDVFARNCWTFHFRLDVFEQAWLNIFYFFKAVSGWNSKISACRLQIRIKGESTCAADLKNWKF